MCSSARDILLCSSKPPIFTRTSRTFCGGSGGSRSRTATYTVWPSRCGAAAERRRRMRIVLLIRSLGCGGAERQLNLFATVLARRHDVSVMTFYAGDDFFITEGL